jgi:hypothetical protein
MNRLERSIVEGLKRGRETYGFVGVRADFEAEGARVEEIATLSHLGHRAGLELVIKIGGCEAMTDLGLAKSFGADVVIAPMIETPFALGKYLAARNAVFKAEDGHNTQFLVNIETITGAENADAILDGMVAGHAVGVVLGRVDFSASMGLSRDAINGPAVTDHVLRIAAGCAARNLGFIVGGGVSEEAIPVLHQVAAVRLDRYETRKIVFDGAALTSTDVAAGLALATQIELDLLKLKAAHYGALASEDHARMVMLRERVDRR